MRTLPVSAVYEPVAEIALGYPGDPATLLLGLAKMRLIVNHFAFR